MPVVSSARLPWSLAWGTAAACVLMSMAGAQPEPWTHPDGSMHYYHAVSVPGGINWFTALDSAQQPGGYLATLTSQAENDFAFGLVDSGIYWYTRPGSGRRAGPWLGGYQPAGSPEPDSGWTWVNAESFGFRNWSPGEPDNSGNGNALNFGELAAGRVRTWNDLWAGDDSIRGFLAELSAESTTIGLLQNDSAAFPGYQLFAPNRSRFTYLTDNKGRFVHSWRSTYQPGQSVYLLENGSLLRTARIGNPDFPAGGTGGRVERFDWDGSLIWAYNYSSTLVCQHHDIEPMPNGNVLLVAWELKTRAEALAAGRNPAKLSANKLWPDHVVEINPANDSIVWAWHLWDHLIQDFDSTKQNYGVVADHSELVDLNYTQAGPQGNGADWLHTNAVDYNPEFDQVIISAHNVGEVWVIDHSTTTEQARGHTGGRQGMGGDILYRWGNPQAYRAGSNSDRKFFGQHDARWIEPGLPGESHLMVFNNGTTRPAGRYSTVDEFIPTSDSTGRYPRPAPGTPHGPAQQCWVYTADPPTSFFSAAISSAHRLPNGNTIVCEGDRGFFFEVTADARVVWRYLNPVTDSIRLFQGDTIPDGAGGADKQNNTFRVTRYPPDYPGLSGRYLTPGYPLEKYRAPLLGIATPGVPQPRGVLTAGPNPFRRTAAISYELPASGQAQLTVYNSAGAEVKRLATGLQSQGMHSAVWDGTDERGRLVGQGLYFCRLTNGESAEAQKLVLQR